MKEQDKEATKTAKEIRVDAPCYFYRLFVIKCSSPQTSTRKGALNARVIMIFVVEAY